MRFSFLLPTRNRLEYLRYAVATIRRQRYEDWEAIISDNASEEDVCGYAEGLGDPRVQCFRTERLLPVTENWNAALEKSDGDYVLMLGDDDGLTPDYLPAVLRLIREHGAPEVIYTGALIFGYPGVDLDWPSGYLRRDRNPLFRSEKPFFLQRATAERLVGASLRLRMLFPYNMQLSLIKRDLIDSLRSHGAFFQSPYPDFYATNVLFLSAQRLLIVPEPLVIIGVTPKSYGFYHVNRAEEVGASFLRHLDKVEPRSRKAGRLLPGSRNNTAWLLAMEAVKENYGAECGLQVDYRRYRLLQILHVYKQHCLDGVASREEFAELNSHLSRWERWLAGLPLELVLRAVRYVPAEIVRRAIGRVRRLAGQYTAFGEDESGGRFGSLLEVFEALADKR